MPESPPCRLCGGVTLRLFETVLIGRHRVAYHQCGSCGLTQTDEPTWLEEAYRRPIHVTDTGLMARNLAARHLVTTFLHLSGVREAPCVDYGAGYGVFVRLMRDAGFQFHWMDKYARNLFADGFEWRDELGTPAACTALEVLEHLVRPREEFARIAALGAGLIVTSTQLPPGGTPAPQWPYLSTESGLHVAFYRPDTLLRLGRECGYPHVIVGPFYQVFARRPFPAWRWTLARRLGAALFPLVRRRRRSLGQADYAELCARAGRG